MKIDSSITDNMFILANLIAVIFLIKRKQPDQD